MTKTFSCLQGEDYICSFYYVGRDKLGVLGDIQALHGENKGYRALESGCLC